MRDIVCKAGLLDPCFFGGVRDIVCAVGCWTAAIKDGVPEIVCAGGCWTAAIKEGCAIASARGGAGSLRSNGACAISSARGLLSTAMESKGDARYLLRRGLLDCCNYRGVREIAVSRKKVGNKLGLDWHL